MKLSKKTQKKSSAQLFGNIPFAASCSKVCFVLRMEMRGVEPLSENPSVRTSPITVSLLEFPQTIAE